MEILIIAVFAIIILLANIYVRIGKLQGKVEELEWGSKRLSKRLESILTKDDELVTDKPGKRSPSKQAEESPSSAGVLPETSAKPFTKPISLSDSAETIPSATGTSASTISPSAPHKQAKADEVKSRSREEWESFIGGKLLNRIGALALIIGLGFFLKYAFDNEWISETVRVLIGASVGFISLGLAYRTHKKGFQIFSQGLIGAGIAILYLSVYASFNFYTLVPQWVAFVLMSCVTALSLALGIYYDSLAIGMLGWAGGFLTPIMLSTGSANEIGLFTYIALLNVGLLAIVFMKKQWGVIEPLTLASTWIMYFAWFFKFYQESDLIVTVFFISVFWILFFGLDFARLRLLNSDAVPLHHSVAALNTILYYIVLYGLIEYKHHDWMAGVTVALAGIYFGAYWWLKLRTSIHDLVLMRYVLTAIALAVMATAIHFENFQTVIAWAIEAAALMWIGTRWKKQFVSYSAVALFLFAIVKLIATHGTFVFDPIESFHLLLNERCLAFVILALTVCVSAYRIPRLELGTNTLTNVFHFTWCIVLFTLVTVETTDFFQQKILAAGGSSAESLNFLRPIVLSMVWLVLSLPILWVGSRQNLEPLIVSSLGLLLFTASTLLLLGLTYVPIAEFIPVVNIRAAAFILTLSGILFHYWRMRTIQNGKQWMKIYIPPLLYLFSALLFIFVTVELNDYFRCRMIDQAKNAIEILAYARLMAFAVVWATLSLPMILIARKNDVSEFRISGLSILLLSVCLIIVRGIEYSPITYFQVILNTRFACGLFVLAVLFIYQYLLASPSREIKWKKEIFQAFQIGIITLSLVLLTGETRDYFEQQIVSTQVGGDALHHLNNLEQLSLSGVWLLYSLLLMVLGFWRSVRSIRIIAFVLFGFTILKIFIYDLSYLETLYRIFSFIGLGLILLAVSYAYQRYKDIIFGSGGRSDKNPV
jgi:uncharacterized membrane protein